MQPSRVLLCLWPGLPRLWLRGCWTGFGGAIIYALCLNFALAITGVWPQMVGSGVKLIAWTVVFGFWSVAFWISWRSLPKLVSKSSDDQQEGLLRQAQAEYLKGNWFDAERILKRMLRVNPIDADVQITLATLYRRAARWKQAKAVLQKLARSEGGQKWRLEIQRELCQLERQEQERARGQEVDSVKLSEVA